MGLTSEESGFSYLPQIHSYGKFDVLVFRCFKDGVEMEDHAKVKIIGPNCKLRVSGSRAVENACLLASSINSFHKG